MIVVHGLGGGGGGVLVVLVVVVGAVSSMGRGPWRLGVIVLAIVGVYIANRVRTDLTPGLYHLQRLRVIM